MTGQDIITEQGKGLHLDSIWVWDPAVPLIFCHSLISIFNKDLLRTTGNGK